MDNTLVKQFIKNYFENNLGVGLNISILENGIWTDFSRGLIDDRNIPTNPSIYYDIASLTKTFTATQILLLIEQGKLKLGQKASTLIPYLEGFETTISDLMTHKSGLHRLKNYQKSVEYTSSEVTQLLRNKENIIEINPGHYFYNDTGYMILGEILEKITGKSLVHNLQQFCNDYNLSEITHLPTELAHLQDLQIAKSEFGLLLGHVQDEKARLFGGVSGHAGIFASLNGLKNFTQLWVEKKFNLFDSHYNQAYTANFDLEYKYFLQDTLTRLKMSDIINYFDEAFGLVWRLGRYSTFPNHSGFAGPITIFNPKTAKALVVTQNITFPVRDKMKLPKIVKYMSALTEKLLS